MADEIKYLIFKGIEKKEQILFKSFLNLSKNELAYQVVILKDGDTSGNQPNIIIVDEDYEFSTSESDLEALPSIKVGNDIEQEAPNYITRPIQWSDFKIALTGLSEAPQSTAGKSEEASDKDEDRVLPPAVEFAIDEIEESSEDTSENKEFDPVNFEYELDNMSIDYHSHTNSDYMQVVDDVQQFKAMEAEAATEPMLLVTDDESGSSNSVLVIETNSLDAWDFSVTESSESDIGESGKDINGDDFSNPIEASTTESSAPKTKKTSGFKLEPNEEYWTEDNEIIVNKRSLLYIKSQRGMVYSHEEPGKWIDAMQGAELSKLPLKADWRPKKGLTAYPINHLVWINTLVTQTEQLTDALSSDAEYILERWPHFDLLQLDNVLLKLCSMMFVNPESLNSLVEKSGYGRSTVRGLMNACYEEGILKKAGEVKTENLVSASNDDGVFGKIKDVFR